MPCLGWEQLPSSCLQGLREEDPGAEHYFQDYFLSRRDGFPEQPKADLQAAVPHC